MSTNNSNPPKIGWACEGPFSFEISSRNGTETLFPLGPLGWEKGEDGKTYQMIQMSGQQLLEKVATASATDQNRAVKLDEDLLPKLKSIEPQLRDSYIDIAVDVLDDVQLMQMAVDTCLFLLVVFKLFFGNLHGFSPQHLLLSCLNCEGKEKWLRSIFFVGNQIPFVMVDMLMESFSFLRGLRDALLSLEERRPSESDPLMLALFNFVTGISQQSNPPASDVVHCLREIILGPKPTQLTIWTGQSKQGTASQLSGEGYSFLPLPVKSGVRGIKFQKSGFGVGVHLPPMKIDHQGLLELMLTNLARYENTHHLEHEVGFYLHSLCRLIQSQDDVHVLRSAGVIEGSNVDTLPGVLKGNFCVAPYYSPTCPSIDIQSCKPRFPFFRKYKKWLIGSVVVINAIVVFGSQLLQSQYTILGYYKRSSP